MALITTALLPERGIVVIVLLLVFSFLKRERKNCSVSFCLRLTPFFHLCFIEEQWKIIIFLRWSIKYFAGEEKHNRTDLQFSIMHLNLSSLDALALIIEERLWQWYHIS